MRWWRIQVASCDEVLWQHLLGWARGTLTGRQVRCCSRIDHLLYFSGLYWLAGWALQRGPVSGRSRHSQQTARSAGKRRGVARSWQAMSLISWPSNVTETPQSDRSIAVSPVAPDRACRTPMPLPVWVRMGDQQRSRPFARRSDRVDRGSAGYRPLRRSSHLACLAL